MEQQKSYKYEIFPTNEQQQMFAQFFGAKRWVYNYFLSEQKARYAVGEKHMSNYDMNYALVPLKDQEETNWLNNIDSIALQNATEDLSRAYTGFFNSLKGKRKGKKLEVPKFKNKYSRQSYRTRGIKISDQGIKLPKFKKPINISYHRTIPCDAKIKSATISKNPSGKYFVSILVEEDIQLLPQTGREVGIDLGIKDLLILSDGIKFQHPEVQIAKTKRLLKKYQRQLARKTKGSNNYNKAKTRIAKAYEKINFIKGNYYHLISNFLVNNYDSIYMENLNVSGMLKNRKLSRAIHESSWSQLSAMIEYKCDWYGKTFYKISRWEPTSKTCSCCGHKLESLKLSTREWTCPSCGTEHDRDINAAMNIKHVGQIDLYNQLKSDATADLVEMPMALQKMVTKIERSDVLSTQFIMGESKPTSKDVGS